MQIYHEVDSNGKFIPGNSIVVINEEDKDLLTPNHVPAWEGAASFYLAIYDFQKEIWYEGRNQVEIDKERAEVLKIQEGLGDPMVTIQELKQQLKDTQEAVNMMMFGGM